MKKRLKILFICVFSMMLVFLLRGGVFGWNPTSEITSAETWGATNDGGIGSSTKRIVGTAINVIRIVGTGIAIIMITYVAIKYMSAAPSEKAEFKKSATAMIVGAIVLFAATNILTVINNFATSNISTGKAVTGDITQESIVEKIES